MTTFEKAFFSFDKTMKPPKAPAMKLPKNAALATSQPSSTASVVAIESGMMNPMEHVKKMRESQWVKLRVLRSHDERHASEPPKHMPATKIPTIAGTLTIDAATPIPRAKAVINVT